MIKFKQNFFIYYRFIKSGLLLDFFIKKIIINISKYFFYVFNVIFNEKYFIENIFFKTLNWNRFVKTYTLVFTNNFSYIIFSLVLVILIIFLLFFYVVINVSEFCKYNI